VRTLVTAMRAHFNAPPLEIGGIDAPLARRRELARRSRAWRCPGCGCDHAELLRSGALACAPEDDAEAEADARRARAAKREALLAKQVMMTTMMMMMTMTPMPFGPAKMAELGYI